MGCPGNGNNVGSFVFVDDVVDGIVKVVEQNNLKGEDFILGGVNMKFKEWLDLISEIAGNKKKPRHFPMFLAKMYASLCELKTKLTKKMPYINKPTVKMINHNWSYSSKKAIEKLDYKITPIREGLEKTVKWYKDYVEKGNKKGV